MAKTMIRLRRARARGASINASTPMQVVKTVLVCLLWIGISPLYVHFIATYSLYLSAQFTVEGIAVFGGIAVHLWPTMSPPWRTIAWTMLAMAITGMLALSFGAGRVALTLATLVAFLVLIGRVNGNARRVLGLVKTWRTLG